MSRSLRALGEANLFARLCHALASHIVVFDGAPHLTVGEFFMRQMSGKLPDMEADASFTRILSPWLIPPD